MPPPSNETNRIREFSLSRLPHMEENPVVCGYCMSSFEIPGIFLDSLKSSMPGGSKWLQTFWNKAAAYNGALVSSETRLSCLACTARVARPRTLHKLGCRSLPSERNRVSTNEIQAHPPPVAEPVCRQEYGRSRSRDYGNGKG